MNYYTAATGTDKITGYIDTDKNKRGINVFTMSQVMSLSGRTKSGEQVVGSIEVPWFGIEPVDRISIYKKCDMIFGIVTGRANRISGMEWSVEKKNKIEDQIEAKLKSLKQFYKEWDGEGIKGGMVKLLAYKGIKEELPEIKLDLSNFEPALLRWRKRIKLGQSEREQEIVDWINEPNAEDSFMDFIKKWVSDLMVQGTFPIYQEKLDGVLENMYGLPGGSVMPIKNRFVGGAKMFMQMIPGHEPLAYFEDEIIFTKYMPTTADAYGMVPMDALLNKITESLLFDSLAASQADGTTPPQKLVLMNEQSPFGDLSEQGVPEVPLSTTERTRIEEVINTPRKNAIKLLTGGYGTPTILDLTRENVFAQQSERQRLLRECAALVFNASNQEVNLTGSEGISGRETSETQYKLEMERGTKPLCMIVERTYNRNILPYRFGTGYQFSFKAAMSDWEQSELDAMKMNSGSWAINEIRNKRGDDPFPEEEFDRPTGVGPKQPDGSQMNPMNVKQVGM